MKTKIVYQWKEKRRDRLSFLGAEVVFSALFGIVNGLIYMLFMTLLPDSVENDPDKLFFYQFSFSSYGIVEFILLIAQIYVFALILTQRVRDFGFKYPITIALFFTIGNMVLTPYPLLISSDTMVIVRFILLLGYIIALLLPSSNNVECNNDENNKITILK
ncbi:hypothetical protein ETG59_12280 [Proteus mirabilis]|uniref:hypothetical protein n=1 Tax=Proteus mirabilis TaxID=584 RepID=UPI0019D276E0|nr:hypothetical protein [Proteus mirabilis]MBI6486427.1 hypothetical protein [Proteus mirabilis]MBN7150932.1 hypothetical protein [Proteus mirabilis]MBN7154651.1 hypothetical protein [Proteus mirabilis]MBN7167414.1 hypothetical protein [Proteus mirabilis]MBN7171112.1 hypothetical protein [Proteus mirabilis]